MKSDTIKLINTLTDVGQFINVVQSEGRTLTEWEEELRTRVSEQLKLACCCAECGIARPVTLLESRVK